MHNVNKLARPLSVLVLFSAFIFGCQPKPKDSFTVNINYQNLDKMKGFDLENGANPGDSGKVFRNSKVLLEEVPFEGGLTPVILDSAALSADNGKISLKGNGKQEGIFQVSVQHGPALLLINDAEEINVNIDLSKHDDYYAVSGSDGSRKLKDFITLYSQRTVEANTAFAEVDSLKQLGASDSMIISATNRKNSQLQNLNRYLKQFISGSDHPALSLFALGWASRSFAREEFETTLNDVVTKFPDHQVLKKLKANYDQQKNQAGADQSASQVSWLGKRAPDLALPGIDGTVLSVSSFKGKYLLVDFWASWCGPCRQENPNVVKAYNTYKNKNFTILGVSLDQDKAKWVNAIKQDQLTWNHVSDLKAWDSKSVEVYKFEGIPFNVLIDPNGIVIGESLRGFDLEKKLSEILK